jgi:YfiH family protein
MQAGGREASSLQRRDSEGLTTYHFESLDPENPAIGGALVHAVFTRRGGVSREPFAALNISENVGDDPAAVAQNRARIFACLGLSADQVAMTGQVHGSHVAIVTADDGGRLYPNTDGLVTDTPGIGLFLRFADCQPILLYDPAHHALGLIHAGWRGVALGIARRAVETMQAAFGTEPRDLIAGLGPAIGPCCYTVGHEVAAAMGYALPNWGKVMHPQGEELWSFDLPTANVQLLRAAGVRRIEQARLCTSCHKDEFFSHRADGGRTGRFAVVAYLTAKEKQPKPEGKEPAQTGIKPEPAEAGPDSLDPPGFPAFGAT